MAIFEVLEPESQLDTSMNITPRQKKLMAPIKRRKSNGTSNPDDKPVLSAMDVRHRAQNRASQRAFRERKQLHTEDLQQQVKKLQTTNQHLIEANVRSAGELSGMKAHIEGLNLEITMLQIELDPQQERFIAWEQECPEKALAPFDSLSDTFGFHTSLDFSTGQSSMNAALDQHFAFPPSRLKTSIGTEAINSRAGKLVASWPC